MKKIWLLATILGAFAPVLACINDRDTLAQEAEAIKSNASGLPHVVRVISGRFERNPPLYYSMRLKRVAKELKRNPAQLALYDDAGAACDRLNRSAEALVWMEKKRRQIEISKLDAKTKREHLYRYFANAGTFHAHLWLRKGANRSDMGELQIGRDMIARAVQIKPNAHFGREKYQLKLMEWILNPPAVKNGDISRDFLDLTKHNGDDNENRLKDSKYPDAIVGLSGLIVLGDAWASFDVYHALMQALGAQGNAPLCVLAGQRCRELLSNGRTSLSPNFAKNPNYLPESLMNWPQTEVGEEAIRAKYFDLRADAMKYQDDRNGYMLWKMNAGLHPDTHPGFWAGWKEPPLPSLDIPNPEQEKLKQARGTNLRRIRQLGVVALIFLAGVLGVFLGRRMALAK